MLAPLVLPEGFVVAGDVFPVGGHVGEEVGAAVRLQDLRDVGVLPRFVAVLVVRAVAVVRPEAVDGPVVGGTGCRVRVPELGL